MHSKIISNDKIYWNIFNQLKYAFIIYLIFEFNLNKISMSNKGMERKYTASN